MYSCRDSRIWKNQGILQCKRLLTFCFFYGWIGHTFTHCGILKHTWNPPRLSRDNSSCPEILGISDKSQLDISFHKKLVLSLLAINQGANHIPTTGHNSQALMVSSTSSMFHPTVPSFTNNSCPLQNNTTGKGKQDSVRINTESRNMPKVISFVSDKLHGFNSKMSGQHPNHFTAKSKKDKTIFTINAKGGLLALPPAVPLSEVH